MKSPLVPGEEIQPVPKDGGDLLFPLVGHALPEIRQ